MAMTKKDLRAIAQAMHELKKDLDQASADGCDNSISLAWNKHLEAMTRICAAGNPLFRASTFREACKGGL